MRSLQTTLVVFDSSVMDPDTFKLIRKLCAEFQLSADIEFTCYVNYMEYLKRFFPDLETQFKQTTLGSNGATTTTTTTMMTKTTKIQQTNQLIDQVLDDVEKTSLLHTLCIISICAKYVNGFRCEKLFTDLSKYLHRNGTPYSICEIRNTEYIVFKLLGFNVSRQKWRANHVFCTPDVESRLFVHSSRLLLLLLLFFENWNQIKPSELYSVAIDLAVKITNRNRDLIIRFDPLHDSCVAMLRYIYLYRKKFNEMYVLLCT